ncbi:alcohol dehydrogenase catalytic domain-containing protein [Spinactinospora alkalitolerans]|nr:zinc-binding dehydrogenase [Spinactinospora alkalitolerans]
MKAARFDTETTTMEVTDVPVPVPRPGEALVKVAACGICHSDLGLIEGYIPSPLPAVTPGHEATGHIAALGAPTPGWDEGDPVLMAAGRACGRCADCVRGHPMDDCLNPEIMAFHYDGAWAEYVVVPVAALVKLPREADLVNYAVLADAVSTPYAAITGTARLAAAESVGIWGLGGLGTHAVQIARMLGAAPIIALDPIEETRARALEVGADHAIDPRGEDTVRRIRELTDGRGLDVAIDGVARSATVPQANAALARHGRLVLMGVSPDPVELGREDVFALSGHRVLGHLGYTRRDLERLVRLVHHGRLDLSRSVSEVLPLDRVHDGVRHLAEHEGTPVRIVIRP